MEHNYPTPGGGTATYDHVLSDEDVERLAHRIYLGAIPGFVRYSPRPTCLPEPVEILSVKVHKTEEPTHGPSFTD